MSALARIELEDAKKELERAHKAAGAMGKGAEGDEADDDADEDEDESNDSEDALWGESRVSLCCPASREALERTFGRVETERASAIAHGSMTIAAESVREVLGEM